MPSAARGNDSLAQTSRKSILLDFESTGNGGAFHWKGTDEEGRGFGPSTRERERHIFRGVCSQFHYTFEGLLVVKKVTISSVEIVHIY